MSEPVPQTEAVNPRSVGLDRLSSTDLVGLLIDEQRLAVDAVYAQREIVGEVVDAVAARMRDGGRLHYVGAGTSGRLGFLDASEMPPTFGTPPDLICAHIAGGLAALTHAVEGAEDDGDAGAAEMRGHVGSGDAVIGVSASGGAPYVVCAIQAAREIGALTVGVSNSDGAPLPRAAQIGIVLRTGPEPLTGSTRLKAGTSQKLLLNAISTAVMVRLGKVHDNLMIDVVATNKKLRRRALGLVEQLTGLDGSRSQDLLDASSGSVKVAVVMGLRGLKAEQARELLDEHGGVLRAVL
ncbi:MAG TPA: N-acetylmuramic acid 6-phosphate etherase [Candidatus Baltobacteraceae bacterium]